MKNHFLFPAWFKYLGLAFAILGIALGAMYVFWSYSLPFLKVSGQESGQIEYISNELAVFLTVLGFLFLGFSRQRDEDELVVRMRLNALQWGIYTYVLFYMFLFLGSEELLDLLGLVEYQSELNIVLPLLLFNLRFYYLLRIKPDYFLTGHIRLLAHRPYLWLGRILAILGLSYFAFIVFSNRLFDVDGAYPKLAILAFIGGMFLWSFSRRKTEDEFTTQLRLNALQASFYLHYFLILIGTATIFSLSYLLFLVLVQFTLLLFNILFLEGFLCRARMQLKKEETLHQGREIIL